MARAPTVTAQVELLVQVTPQDSPHEPLQVFLLLQNKEQVVEPPQVLWETSQAEPLTQMQVASTQFSGLPPLQPAQSMSGRQHRISARIDAPQARWSGKSMLSHPTVGAPIDLRCRHFARLVTEHAHDDRLRNTGWPGVMIGSS